MARAAPYFWHDARVAYVNIPGEADQPRLEGVWIGNGERIAVVAPPHPLMGGHLLNPVVQAVAVGLRDLGMRCMLFNWRGVGESDGHPSGAASDADSDFRAALAAASEAGVVSVAAGYSFGGASAIRVAAETGGLHVVAVAPPPTLFDAGLLAHVSGSVLLIAAEYDPFAPPSDYLSVVAGAPRIRLETIPNTGHDFGGRLAAVRDKVRGTAASA